MNKNDVRLLVGNWKVRKNEIEFYTEKVWAGIEDGETEILLCTVVDEDDEGYMANDLIQYYYFLVNEAKIVSYDYWDGEEEPLRLDVADLKTARRYHRMHKRERLALWEDKILAKEVRNDVCGNQKFWSERVHSNLSNKDLVFQVENAEWDDRSELDNILFENVCKDVELNGITTIYGEDLGWMISDRLHELYNVERYGELWFVRK